MASLSVGSTAVNAHQLPDRGTFTAWNIVAEIWMSLDLPATALAQLSLPGDETGPVMPSSFKIGHLAQSTVALSALTAAQVHALPTDTAVPQVTVSREAAVVEFQSERLYVLNGQPARPSWGSLGGLYPTGDGGHVRIHDVFPHHHSGMLDLLGLARTTTSRDAVAARTRNWAAIDLENVALDRGLAIYALRTYCQWDQLPQAKALADMPVSVEVVGEEGMGVGRHTPRGSDNEGSRCLGGLRVLELSRVIAGPVAGRTLAAHGADVLWVTTPNLPDCPGLDRDLARGKRTVQLDLDDAADRATLLDLARTCDVFLQSYRPGSLAEHTDGALSPEQLAAANPGIICANLSAFGPEGPWAGRRGFDSLVQTCSGMNVSEGEHYGQDGQDEQGEQKTPRPLPCQALDHGAGYLLAAGIAAAVYRRNTEARANGHLRSYRVDVSLAGVMKYLRSLGQYPGRTGFDAPDGQQCCYASVQEVPTRYLETRETGFGVMQAVQHSASVEGCASGWEVMPRSLGSDEAAWRSEEKTKRRKDEKVKNDILGNRTSVH